MSHKKPTHTERIVSSYISIDKTKKELSPKSKKSYIKFPYIRDEGLPLRMRPTLALLLYKQRQQDKPGFRGASVRWLAEKNKGNRDTIKAHLAVLIERRYAEKKDGRYIAIDNPNYIRIQGSHDKRWLEQIAYIKIELPIPKDRNKSMLLPILLLDYLSHVKKTQTQRGLAKLFGAENHSVGAAIAYLAHRKWIRAEKQWVVYPSGKQWPRGYVIEQLKKDWLKPKSKSAKAKPEATEEFDWPTQDMEDRFKAFAVDPQIAEQLRAMIREGRLIAASVCLALGRYFGDDVNNFLITEMGLLPP